ncbi:Uncharacterised protein [Enterobacter hormaechei]|uniref:hypothetical protein n=1 Tax=Enterobacter hormaechei TaxID=158836 RepID=UPI001258FC74|nr:hypothetical protein [Enterobacter hormaechei]VAE69517.1 Uncharacterised protein [Enterobacter hormaechei]
MKQKFIEWFTKNNNGCSPAMEDDRSFVHEKTQHMFEAYLAGVAEGEAKCAALAAENAGLKAVCEDRRAFIMNGVQLGYIQVPTVETDPALETIRVAVSPQEPTPATDAFLAEVRAAAVDEVCLKISNAIVNCYQDEQVGLDAAATICGDFAAQLRKGVQS